MKPKDISKTMTALKRAFGEIIKDKEKAGDLAFNYAEIFVELPMLKDQLQSIMVNGTATPRDMQELHTFTVHWLYHLGEINSLIVSISEDSSD